MPQQSVTGLFFYSLIWMYLFYAKWRHHSRSVSTALMKDLSSSSVGRWPREIITWPSSSVVIIPSPFLSNMWNVSRISEDTKRTCGMCRKSLKTESEHVECVENIWDQKAKCGMCRESLRTEREHVETVIIVWGQKANVQNVLQIP